MRKLLCAALLSAALISLAPAKQSTSDINNIVRTPANVEQARKPVTQEVAPLQEKTPEPVKNLSEPVVATPEPVKAPEPAPQPNTPEAWMQAVGIPVNEREAVKYVLGQESGFCPTKWEGEYGACPAYHGVPQDDKIGYGLCQSTPANKMASAGDDWATNPITQLKWCNEYAKGYGGWIAGAEFKKCTGWCYSRRIAATVFKHTPYW